MKGIQRVLIPTDFTVNSLRIVLEYLESSGHQPIELVLVSGYDPGDSISGLLASTKYDHLSKLQGEDFVKGCEMIRSRFEGRVVEMYADIFTSKNHRYLHNSLIGNRVTQVVLPQGFTFRFADRSCFDVAAPLAALGQHGRIPMVTLCMPVEDMDSMDNIDTIFFRKDWRVSYE